MNWVRVSETRYDCGEWVVRRADYPRPDIPSLWNGWYAYRRREMAVEFGPCATAEEAMRAVEAAVGEVA